MLPSGSGLSRQFDHRPMKDASAHMAKRSDAGSDLHIVSYTFVHLQEKRHEADYDLTVNFSIVDVTLDLSAAMLAFESWERIKGEQSARDYLFSLLFKDRT
jgi:hypothetical protein